jgi:hypothetical protein
MRKEKSKRQARVETFVVTRDARIGKGGNANATSVLL